MSGTLTRLDKAIEALPLRHAGPGGAVAVLHEGVVLARHSWGWADVERRLPFTPQTLFRVCSITKQFTCGLVLDQFPDPTVLDGDVARRLPALREKPPSALHLCHNQSGLRDYWALTSLCGSPVEAPFGQAQSDALISRLQTLHFTPGTRYSYCNENFRLLGEIVAARAGVAFDELLQRRILAPAGMATARMCADTSAMPDGTIGYEGSVEAGFRPTVNRIIWTGDAGLGASLDDMIAWEQFIDGTRDQPGARYHRQAAPNSFADGTPAQYGFGVSQMNLLGHRANGHGGGLRGWRSLRSYLPAERISIVVLFNHMAEPRDATLDLLAAVLDISRDKPAITADPGWRGSFIEPESGLAVRLETTADNRVRLHFAGSPDVLDPTADNTAQAGNIRLRRTDDGIWMDRMGENLCSRLEPCEGPSAPDIEGVFHSAELGADFTCVATGGVLYGAFSGFLGPGLMETLMPFGPDVWRFPCPRALDYSAPGDWTLRFRRNDAGEVSGVDVGCWLARRVAFEKI